VGSSITPESVAAHSLIFHIRSLMSDKIKCFYGCGADGVRFVSLPQTGEKLWLCYPHADGKLLSLGIEMEALKPKGN